MSNAKRLLLAPAGGDLRSLAGTVVRPAIEAMLLAAVALGIGQAGWTAVAPAQASASGADGASAGNAAMSPARLAASPFAPRRAAGDYVGLADLGTVRLIGVRMAEDPMRSGAVVSLSGGAQQAVLAGQDVMAGVRLDRVEADGIVVSLGGRAQRIALPAANGPSSAQLLMGQAGPSAPTVAQFGAAEQEWFAATLADPVTEGGAVIGYRLAAPLPGAAREAGFAEGDVIVSINGAPAAEPLAAIAAVSTGGSVALGVRPRSGGTERVVRFALPQGSAAALSSAGLGLAP
jgi:Type II secretion system protein C